MSSTQRSVKPCAAPRLRTFICIVFTTEDSVHAPNPANGPRSGVASGSGQGVGMSLGATLGITWGSGEHAYPTSLIYIQLRSL